MELNSAHESATLTAERGESDSSPPVRHTPRGGDSPRRDAAFRHDVSWSHGDRPGQWRLVENILGGAVEMVIKQY